MHSYSGKMAFRRKRVACISLARRSITVTSIVYCPLRLALSMASVKAPEEASLV